MSYALPWDDPEHDVIGDVREAFRQAGNPAPEPYRYFLCVNGVLLSGDDRLLGMALGVWLADRGCCW